MLSLHQAALSFSAPHVRAPRASVSMMAKSESMPFMDCPPALDGSMAGDVGFDPLGLSSMGIPLAYMREAELKHGRVCMLATVGWIATDTGLRAPGMGAGNPLMGVSSYAAHDAAVAQGSLLVLLIFCGVLEIAGYAGLQATLAGEDRAPGDFALTGGFDKDPKTLERMKMAEIKHSRLAMMAFSGIATQSAIAHGEVGFPYF